MLLEARTHLAVECEALFRAEKKELREDRCYLIRPRDFLGTSLHQSRGAHSLAPESFNNQRVSERGQSNWSLW
jgi:hypothetical protein